MGLVGLVGLLRSKRTTGPDVERPWMRQPEPGRNRVRLRGEQVKGGDPYPQGEDPYLKGGDPYPQGGDPYPQGGDPSRGSSSAGHLQPFPRDERLVLARGS